MEKFEEHYLHIYFSLTANNDLTTDTPILSPKYPQNNQYSSTSLVCVVIIYCSKECSNFLPVYAYSAYSEGTANWYKK